MAVQVCGDIEIWFTTVPENMFRRFTGELRFQLYFQSEKMGVDAKNVFKNKM